MNQIQFNESFEALTPKQRKILLLFLKGESDQAIAEALYCATCTIRKHISNICKVFGLENDQGEHFSHRDDLVDLFAQYKPELVNFDLWDSYRPQLLKPDIPGRPVNPKSPFYIKHMDEESSCIESICVKEVLKPGALLRIKAPTKMGKTSLLNHVLSEVENLGCRIVRLNLRQAEPFLNNLDRFLQWFCSNISKYLNLELRLHDYWDNEWLGSLTSCTTYFQDYLLEQIDSPLVLGLDEIDWLFKYPTIAEPFFSLLRGWHEEASKLGNWEKLRLVVVYSTEVYIPLNINKSPFNVGRVVNLPELNLEQVRLLAKNYGLKWAKSTEAEQLMAMVGGHPYLIQLALYYLCQENMTLSQLLETAPTIKGIYRNHLQNLSVTLQENSDLREVLLKLINTNSNIQPEPTIAYKLESLGLIKFDDNQIKISCQLYRCYFQQLIC